MPNASCIFYTTSSAELRDQAERLEADGTIELATVATSETELLDEVRANRPAVVVADLGVVPEATLDLLEKLPVPRPRLLVIGPPDQSAAILRAMRMGVKEYFESPPTEEQLRRVLASLSAEIVHEDDPAEKPARVVAVMGAKGGAGATFVACQIAASLQAGGARTAIVDLNLPLGDVGLHFDVQPAYTLANIARESERLDPTYLRTLLQGHRSGVQILASPSHAEEAELVKPVHIERVLALLRADFDWVVLDVSRAWSENTVRVLDLADQILLVTLMDVPTLHHTRQHIDLLERLGHTGRRLRLIANRYTAAGPVTDKDVTAFLDREPDFRIPNDYPTTLASVNRGLSVAEVAPRCALARAYAELNRSLHDWSDVTQPKLEARGALARAVGLFRRS